MQQESERPRQYAWPKYVLAAFILGVVLAVIWMSAEVRKVRKYRDSTMDPRNHPSEPAATTNADSPAAATER
ncbi:MAG TPA: hypothetical protein GYA07_10270 [Verrucomicrobia bacterium]|nr:hypothetical protein [Verrucomicrobiota bacterium]HOP97838.1 hypothetical protein [Verrucomicrobiota bacterium]